MSVVAAPAPPRRARSGVPAPPAPAGPVAPVPTSPVRPRAAHPRLAALLLVLLAALPACTVRYVAEYDPRIEETAIVLQREMDSFLTSIEIAELEGDRAYAARREFYANYAVDLRSLRVRAAAQPLNDITLQQLDLMLESLETLRTLHEEQGELSDAAVRVNRELFNTAWGAILAWESQKKRGEAE